MGLWEPFHLKRPLVGSSLLYHVAWSLFMAACKVIIVSGSVA
jgi:hypothetical protein